MKKIKINNQQNPDLRSLKENYEKGRTQDNPPPLPPLCVCRLCMSGSEGGAAGCCTFSSSSTQTMWESSS